MGDLTHVIVCTFTTTRPTPSAPIESTWWIGTVEGERLWGATFAMYPEGDGHPQTGWDDIPMEPWLRGLYRKWGMDVEWQHSWEAGTLYTPFAVVETVTSAMGRLGLSFGSCVAVTDRRGLGVFSTLFPQLAMVTRAGGIVDVDSLSFAMAPFGGTPAEALYPSADSMWLAGPCNARARAMWRRWAQLITWAQRPVAQFEPGRVLAADARITVTPGLKVTGEAGEVLGDVVDATRGVDGVEIEMTLNEDNPTVQALRRMAAEGLTADSVSIVDEHGLEDGPRWVDGCTCAGCVTARADEQENEA